MLLREVRSDLEAEEAHGWCVSRGAVQLDLCFGKVIPEHREQGDTESGRQARNPLWWSRPEEMIERLGDEQGRWLCQRCSPWAFLPLGPVLFLLCYLFCCADLLRHFSNTCVTPSEKHLPPFGGTSFP